jgi:hypothetical protein
MLFLKSIKNKKKELNFVINMAIIDFNKVE